MKAPCVVVFAVDETRRRGFTYGTLPGHPECGEELFLVEHRDDDTVRLTIRAFSRPALWWSQASAPAGRLVQRAVTARYLGALKRQRQGPFPGLHLMPVRCQNRPAQTTRPSSTRTFTRSGRRSRNRPRHSPSRPTSR